MSGLPQQASYAEDERLDIQPHLPRDARSALDVGCGRGGFGITLRRELGPTGRIVGIEAVEASARIASQGHGFDEVVHGYFPEALGDREDRFDLVCFNDVLEHILDPGKVLREVHHWLVPGGRVLAAIPNIQYAPVVWQLVRGRWDYGDDGTLDRTHVRFFTRATMIELFEDAGYHVETCVGMNGLYEARWSTDPMVPRRLVKRLIARALRDGQYLHFLVVAREDADSPGSPRTRPDLDTLEP